MASHVAIVTANKIASLKETRMGVLHKKLLNAGYIYTAYVIVTLRGFDVKWCLLSSKYQLLC